MLTKLIPEQVSKFWDVIKYGLEQSLPPIVIDSDDTMNNILSSILAGRTEVWMSYKKDNNKFEGMVVTKFIYDDASDSINLLLYALYGYAKVDEDSWLVGIATLTKYAKAKGCKQIVAYTANPRIVEITKQLNGNADFTFCSFDI